MTQTPNHVAVPWGRSPQGVRLFQTVGSGWGMCDPQTNKAWVLPHREMSARLNLHVLSGAPGVVLKAAYALFGRIPSGLRLGGESRGYRPDGGVLGRCVQRLLTYQLECGVMDCNGRNGYRGLGFDPGEWA